MIYKNEYIANIYRLKDHEDRREYLRLDMNENPEGLPKEFVQEVVYKITPEFLATYPQKGELIDSIAKREHVEADNITLVNGSDEGIRLIFEVFTHAGGRVLMAAPTFEMYQVYAKMFGLHIDTVSFQQDFSIDIESLLAAITEQTNLVVILNPNSPIGTAFTSVEFDRIAAQTAKMGALLLVDEAYYPFGVQTKAQYYKIYPHVMVLRTFSKLYSIAALRLGFLIGSTEYIHLIENAQSTYNVNSVGILFAQELLKREDILQNLEQSIEEGRAYLTKKLEETGYDYYAASGNYILLKSKREPKITAQRLKDEHILVKIYRAGAFLEEWIRVTVGSRRVMEQFWESFYKAEGEDI